MQFSGKIGQIVGWRPTICGWCTPFAKSWIRQCFRLFRDEVHKDDTDKVRQLTEGNEFVCSVYVVDWGGGRGGRREYISIGGHLVHSSYLATVVYRGPATVPSAVDHRRQVRSLAVRSISGDNCPGQGFKSRVDPSLVRFVAYARGPRRFISGATPANLLVAMPISPTYFFKQHWGSNPSFTSMWQTGAPTNCIEKYSHRHKTVTVTLSHPSTDLSDKGSV